jgi:hypothetical protein
MGRGSKGDGFEGVFGARRGAGVDLASLAPNRASAQRASEMAARIERGDHAEAIALLAEHRRDLTPPLLGLLARSLAQSCVRDMLDRDDELYRGFLSLVGLSSTWAASLATLHSEGHARTHIWPQGPSVGDIDLRAKHGPVVMACGLRAHHEDVDRTVRRGSWTREPSKRCAGCAPHSDQAEDCWEGPGPVAPLDREGMASLCAAAEDLVLSRLGRPGALEALDISRMPSGPILNSPAFLAVRRAIVPWAAERLAQDGPLALGRIFLVRGGEAYEHMLSRDDWEELLRDYAPNERLRARLRSLAQGTAQKDVAEELRAGVVRRLRRISLDAA